MKWLLARLSEPSTWAGFAALIPTAFTLISSPLTPQALGAAVAGLAAVMMKEKQGE